MIDKVLEYSTNSGVKTEHLLVKQSEPVGLVVLLSGANNNPERPILHLIRKGLLDVGYDTLNINYDGVIDHSLEKDVFFDRLSDLLSGVIDSYIKKYADIEISIIGRSLGSILVSRAFDEMRYDFNKAVLISPLNMTVEEIEYNEFLVFTSSEDDRIDEKVIHKLKSMDTIKLHIYENADHNLEIDNDMDGTIDIIRDVVKKTIMYITNLTAR